MGADDQRMAADRFAAMYPDAARSVALKALRPLFFMLAGAPLRAGTCFLPPPISPTRRLSRVGREFRRARSRAWSRPQQCRRPKAYAQARRYHRRGARAVSLCNVDRPPRSLVGPPQRRHDAVVAADCCLWFLTLAKGDASPTRSRNRLAVAERPSVMGSKRPLAIELRVDGLHPLRSNGDFGPTVDAVSIPKFLSQSRT